MRYWHLSTIVSSPILPAAFLPEVEALYSTNSLSMQAVRACADVAWHTAPMNMPIAVLETVGSPHSHRVFHRYPDFEEWFALERGCMVYNPLSNTLHVIVDALH